GESPADIALLKIISRMRGHIAEDTSPLVEEQLRLLGEGLAHLFRIPIDMAVGHGQIELAVQVRIAKNGAKAETLERSRRQPGLIAPVLEEQLPLIAVKHQSLQLEVGHDQGRLAAAINVSGIDSHAGHGSGASPQRAA